MRAGHPIQWNDSDVPVTNLPEAGKIVQIEYRDGWEL